MQAQIYTRKWCQFNCIIMYMYLLSYTHFGVLYAQPYTFNGLG